MRLRYFSGVKSGRLRSRMPSRISRRERLGKGPPFHSGIVLIDLLQLAQQMHQAILPVGRVDRLVRRPEVVQQDAVEGLAEEALQDGTAATPVDRVVTDLAIGKTPQPASLAPHPPAGLVGVQVGRCPGFLGELLVPGRENLRRPLPGGDQPARREPGSQVELQDVDEPA